MFLSRIRHVGGDDDPIIIWYWPSGGEGGSGLPSNLWMVSPSSQIGSQNACDCCVIIIYRVCQVYWPPSKSFQKNFTTGLNSTIFFAAHVLSGGGTGILYLISQYCKLLTLLP